MRSREPNCKQTGFVKRISNRRGLIFFVWGCIFFIALVAAESGLAADQSKWSALPAIDSYTSPAVSEHSDGKVYIAGVAFSGIVAYTSTDSPTGWGSWDIIGPAPSGGIFDPAFYADPETNPVLLRHGTRLYLFTRGRNDNLYETHKEGAGWSNWQQLTSEGDVKGRISIALTKPAGTAASPASNQSHAHVIYKTTGNVVIYRRFLITAGAWSEAGVKEQWTNAVEGTIGTDGANQLLAVIRRNDRQLLVEKKLRPWNAVWKTLFFLQPTGASGDFFDITNIVYLGEAFHFAYAKKYRPDDVSPSYAHVIEHFRVPPGRTESGYRVDSYNPTVMDPEYKILGTSHPSMTLAGYRNKLVLAYKDPAGWVRYARWDNADKSKPWLGNGIVDPSRRTDERPALGVFSNRPNISWADYGNSNIGNDLIAAITERTTDSILYANFSRAMHVDLIETQFNVYTSNSDTLDPVCRNQSEPFAPTLVTDLGSDGRPFLTELGYVLWTLPEWFIGDFFAEAGTRGCLAGNTSGRFDPPCDDAKYPVIILGQGRSGICNGVWVHRADSYKANVFHELCHSLSGSLGFSDKNSEPPTSSHATEIGISLTELSSGFNIFGQNVNGDCISNEADDTCPDTRATGFTGYANNYDVSTRQHSFIGAMTFYFADGDQFRNWIKDDIAAGDTLLQQKYDWIKKNIFESMQFRKDNDPYVKSIDLPDSMGFYPYPATQSAKKNADPTLARPIGVGSVADGGGSVSIEVGTLEFAGPVDAYLLIAVDPANIFVIKSDLTIQHISAGLPAWKTNTTGPIDNSLFGDIPVAALPKLTYFLGLMVTPAGDLSRSYLWVTSFVVP